MVRPMQAARWSGVALVLLLLTACERPQTVQQGYRGTSQIQLYQPSTLAAAAALNAVPEPEPVDDPDPEAPKLEEVYKNVQVLTDLSVLDFSRLMQAMSTWVAPEEGCAYCHNTKNLASDEKYAKIVARHMLQMTRNINSTWKTHVGETGVTCYTCHRGQPVPSGDWFKNPGLPTQVAADVMGGKHGQNTPTMATVGNASLPYDPLSMFLESKDSPSIRVQGERALAGSHTGSIKLAENTYGLMIYISNSLGVNCTFCHQTRAMANWQQSSPQRVTAWHGIRMVRDLNTTYLSKVGPLLPEHRLSAEGDHPKVGCATCHKGANKPLYGARMLPDYPELGVGAKAPYAGGATAFKDVESLNPYKSPPPKPKATTPPGTS
jgi:photosynthetic reaction center cytochrome c subunit